MGRESASYISQLVTTNPTGSDPKSSMDDHVRLIKTVLQSQFTSLGAAPVTITAAELNASVGAALAAAAAAGATVFSGTTAYAQYAAVISPVNLQTYRRNTAGTNATDPSSDSTNWTAITTGSAAVLTSINGGAVSGMKNRCINGMMEVSQRGDFTTASASVSGTYYLDRWYTDHSIACNKQQTTGNSVTNLGASCNAFKLIATASGTGYLGFAQKYEWFSELSGKQITLSVYVKSNSANARVYFYCATTGQIAISSAHTGGGGWERLSVLATVSAGLTSFLMNASIMSSGGSVVTITSGDYLEATGFQLKDGDCRNELYNEWRPYPMELALCQRYLPTWSGRILSSSGQFTSTTSWIASLPLFVTPRVAPTGILLSSAVGNFYVWNASGSTLNCTGSINFGYGSLGAVLVNGSVASGGVAGNATSLFTSSSADTIFGTGCEL